MTRACSLILCAFLLGGCAGGSVKRFSSVEPVCTGLIGPIHYNSSNKASRRYAGPDLAPDLNQRNQVGIGLRCPKYR